MNFPRNQHYGGLKSAMRAVGRVGLALFLFGIATRVAAQVYSVNYVGYVPKTIPLVGPVTLAYIANPLNSVDNRLSSILPGVPNGTMIYAYRANAFEAFTYFDGWLPGDTTLHPGEGVIIALDQSTAPNPTVLVFIGEIPQGMLVNPIPAGFSLKASQVPQSGRISSDLALNPRDSDALYLFHENTQSHDRYDYFTDGEFSVWAPFEPTVQVGQSFWYYNASGSVNNWTRFFTINNWTRSFSPDPFAASKPASVTPSAQGMPCFVGPVLLSIARRIPSQVEISWPFEFSSYQLEHTAGPVAGGWSYVAQQPMTVGGRRRVTLATSTPHDFFRLSSVLGQAPVLFAKACGASALTLFWHRNFTGFQVEQIGSVASGPWTPIAEQATDTNGFWQLTVPLSGPIGIFRLRS